MNTHDIIFVKGVEGKMSKRIYGKEYGFQTRAVHTGNDTDGETGAIKRPITMANSYELPYDPSDLNWSSADKSLYTRNGGSNQKYLQEKVASLEGGEDCVVLASGVAALSGLFFALLKSGDHVIFSSVTYIAVYRLLNELFNNKFNIETTIVDTTNPENVKKAIRPNTKLIHIETPGNPTLMISDIRKIAEIAHENGALLSVDNTFASPYNQRPIELGADFTIESLTKYINGHGDAMGDAIIGKTKYLDIIRAQSQMINGYGGVLSFGLKADHDTHNRFVSYLKVITSAVSLGHDESLIVFLGEDDERQYLYPEEFHNGFFRFSVGIEDIEDIIGDLEQAFKKTGLL